MKVLVVFGTRPEAIKMCPLVLELKKHIDIETILCLTGQHKEMLDQVMEIFGIKADYNFSVMKDGQTLSMITTAILTEMDKIIQTENPNVILVHGDTTSAFAAALASFYHQIPVAHVEAGLRTYNMQSPYPEEFNRQAIDLMTAIYFAPTENARQQLLDEGKNDSQIFVTGNTVIDALRFTIKGDYYNEDLEWAADSKLILMTVHRRENIGQNMINIFKAIKKIIKNNRDLKVIYPIHKNPKIREIAATVLGNEDRIRLIEPLDVLDFHNFMRHSYLILTDSGGIQEEAQALGKPVLVMRDTTERPEGVEAGTLKLVGTEEKNIYESVVKLLLDHNEYMNMSKAINPYGDGHTSEKIVEVLREYAESIISKMCEGENEKNV